MILEVAVLDVKPSMETAFEDAFKSAQSIISAMTGYISHELQRSLETPNRYLLLVNWQTLEDHTVGFRGHDQYQEWRMLLHHFYSPFPEVWHFEPLLSNLKKSAPILIRPGSVEEALAVEQQIPEFDIKRTAQDYKFELANKTSSILVAVIGEKIVGFKVGYERANDNFYSWLGGVIPEHRNQKIATLLREQQEHWATAQGYKRISVNSYNKFSAMICMLVSSGYVVTHFKEHENHFKSRISFTKHLA